MRELMGCSIIFLFLITGGWAIKQFCSVICSRTSCNDNTVNGCNNQCFTNWVPLGSTCTPNSANNFYIADKTADLGGGLVVSPTNTPTTDCSSFSAFGPFTTQTITVTSSGGITVPFFQMYAYFGIISYDAQRSGGSYWNSATAYTLTAAGGSLSQTNIYKLYLSTKVQSQRYCEDNNRAEYWNKIAQLYTWNQTNTAITFSLNYNQSNTSNQWVLKEFVIVYRSCHLACTQCFGPAATQCYLCMTNATVTMWQSNNTCNQSCLTGFGYMSVPNVCVFCDLHCRSCYDSPTNCSSCTLSGIYLAYFFAVNSSCLNPCPPGYFANKTTQTCDICNVNCTACINNANYCTACVQYFGYANHVCYSPCPIGYYNNTNGLNCTACSPYCYICVDPFDLCTVCTTTGPYVAYLYNTTNLTGSCVRNCPVSYYAQNFGGAGPNLCRACNVTCLVCTGFPTPCQQCVAGYYLYSSDCWSSCPNTTFASNSTGTGVCLQCSTWCVSLTIKMYFSNSLNSKIYIDMMFSRNMDFSIFDMANFQDITINSNNMQYTKSMFNFTYQNKSKSFYRITIEPIGYIFLYNVTFTVTTRSTRNTTSDYSIDNMPFMDSNYQKTASLSWFLIKGPPFSKLEENIMESFATLSSKTNDFLDLPYVQEIKKSGVFNLLFSGAQITSCTILSNQIQSQNLYEGVRFWAIFVFFDVPPYEQISNQTKRFISPTVEDKIRDAQEITNEPRSLFSTDSMYWRFQRTGQTSFFIYDCYIPIFLIVACWILIIIAYKCKHKHWYSLHAPKLFSAVHKVHEISILYITMASIVEYIYFQPTTMERYVSAGVCALFNLYFVIYQLYIYYDMLLYPMAQIGNRLYDYYVIRYGSFLKNIRYEQYDINERWSPRHWFRPYNFHFLSYYKKFLMIISLPLFYSTFYAQMAILAFIQLMQLIRVWVVWPFLSRGRNWLRISLELALFLFFLVNIVQIKLLQEIQTGDINAMGDTITIFYGFGWSGFVLCFYFNIVYVITSIYDLCVGIKISNRTKMDNARKHYFYGKIKQYEKDNQAANKDLVKQWEKQGNLSGNYFGELPEINVRIEEYGMMMVLGKFQLTVRKITELRMLQKRNHKKRNNTVTRKKIEKKGYLVQHANSELYSILYAVYEKYASNHIERVTLKTFLNVFQPEFAEGEEVPFDRSRMFQRVQLISYDNEREQRQLQQLIEGFPLPGHLLDKF